MNLPNYFLADLPPEAVLGPDMIREGCQALKRNRDTYLVPRNTTSLIRVLCEVAQSWLRDDYAFRQLAISQGPDATGFSSATISSGLNGFFSELKPEKFETLLDQELGHAQRLDQIVANRNDELGQRASVAIGPSLIANVSAGKLPNPIFLNICFGLLIRSAQFIKCSQGASFLPRLFAHSIYEVEPKLGACIEIAEWKGGNTPIEDALFAEADLILATGSNETVSAIRNRVPIQKKFIGYGHRVSFGYITQEALSGFNSTAVIKNAARDIIAWNQSGCLSPHVFYVEFGGKIAPEDFASRLAVELERVESIEPRGKLDVDESALIASRRSFYDVRAANSDQTRCWWSKDSTAWSVVYETDSLFQISCLNRFIYVKGISGIEDALRGADAIRGQVSTVGVAATENRGFELAGRFARWGATRVCPLGKMQNPPITWRHDGRPPLGELITWMDWEL